MLIGGLADPSSCSFPCFRSSLRDCADPLADISRSGWYSRLVHGACHTSGGSGFPHRLSLPDGMCDALQAGAPRLHGKRRPC